MDGRPRRLDDAGWGTGVVPRRPRSWNSVYIGIGAFAWVAQVPEAADWFLPGRGWGPALFAACGYFAIAAVATVSGACSAMRSLFERRAPAVAVVGLLLNATAAAMVVAGRRHG